MLGSGRQGGEGRQSVAGANDFGAEGGRGGEGRGGGEGFSPSAAHGLQMASHPTYLDSYCRSSRLHRRFAMPAKNDRLCEDWILRRALTLLRSSTDTLGRLRWCRQWQKDLLLTDSRGGRTAFAPSLKTVISQMSRRLAWRLQSWNSGCRAQVSKGC